MCLWLFFVNFNIIFHRKFRGKIHFCHQHFLNVESIKCFGFRHFNVLPLNYSSILLYHSEILGLILVSKKHIFFLYKIFLLCHIAKCFCNAWKRAELLLTMVIFTNTSSVDRHWTNFESKFHLGELHTFC